MLAPRRRDEGLADAPAVLAADRDVLQVGIVRAQAPGGGAGLVVAGVHAAGVPDCASAAACRCRCCAAWPGRGVRGSGAAVRAGRRSPPAPPRWSTARRWASSPAPAASVPRTAAAPSCLGESRLKARPAISCARCCARQHALRQIRALPAQLVHVDRHAVGFHALEHRHQRHLDVAVDALQARLGGQLRRQLAVQAQRDVGVLGGVARWPPPAPPARRGSASRPCRRRPRSGWSSSPGSARPANPCRGAGRRRSSTKLSSIVSSA